MQTQQSIPLYSSSITESVNGLGWQEPLEVIWSKSLLHLIHLEKIA